MGIVYDEDSFDSDDLVCSGSFNSGVEIQFKYSLKI
jgi:hypothetical protein